MRMPYPTLVSCRELGLSPQRAGKVRELFDLGEHLLLVATDRISAFDVVMDDPVPGRGALLTQMTLAWYELFGSGVRHHLVHADADRLPAPFAAHAGRLRGRVMLVRKARRLDIEAVVRGYLAGSGFKDYVRTGAVCGHPLPPGLPLCAELPQPLFTPSTKAERGHDRNIDLRQAADIVGRPQAEAIRDLSLRIYTEARAYARTRGILIADTKFEFGVVDDAIVLIDELLTPDSSRYWDAATWALGREPDSMDKQILRNHLETLPWGKTAPAPRLSPEIVERTAAGYVEIFRRLFPDPAARSGF
jgi:phosphoribosylaminoimidazole-succinocarboxamide synthase